MSGDGFNLKRILATMTLIIAPVCAPGADENPPAESRFRRGELSNGMTLIVARDTAAPRAFVTVAVNAGSVDEPGNATGLAHYLEHLLFKGTGKIGALDYEREKPILDEITDLYEAHRATGDEACRREIYAEIDRLSTEAAKYSAADEYSVLLQSIGAVGVNASTSYDFTEYHCEVPVNELEKLFVLEAERFSDPVFRRFHTELETVYEEFNRFQDNDIGRMQEAAMEALFGDHPYGRFVIGTPEDLKNPSLAELEKFYADAYTPEDMVLIVYGDVNYDEVAAMAERTLAPALPRSAGRLPDRPPLPEFVKGETREVAGPAEAMTVRAWRLPNTDENMAMITLLDARLCYREIGSLEKLSRSGALLEAGSFVTELRDAIVFACYAVPGSGVSLDDAGRLLDREIRAVVDEPCPEWLPGAVADNLRYDTLLGLEKPASASRLLLGAENRHRTVDDVFNVYEMIRDITPEDFQKFARREITGKKPAVVNKIQVDGAPETVRVPKPEVTPVPLNSDRESEYRKYFTGLAAAPAPEPEFPEFDEIFETVSMDGGRTLLRLPDRGEADRFSLRLCWDFGTLADPRLGAAMSFWQKLGAGGMDNDAVKLEWFKIGCRLSVSAEAERLNIRVDGLNRNFGSAVKLLGTVMREPVPDDEALAVVIGKILDERRNERTRADAVSDALCSYAVYGPVNPRTGRISKAELEALDSRELAALPGQLLNYPFTVCLYGGPDAGTAARELSEALPAAAPAEAPKNIRFKYRDFAGSEMLHVDFPGSQCRVIRLRRGLPFSRKTLPFQDIYNDLGNRAAYNILREARALGYVAGSYVMKPDFAWQEALIATRVDCQNDKLPEAVAAVGEFDRDFAVSEAEFEMAMTRYRSILATRNPSREGIFDMYLANRDRGIAENIRGEIFRALPGMTAGDFDNYLNLEHRNRDAVILLVGEKENIPEEMRRNYRFRTVTMDDIFGAAE